jgi:hypothetical protein
VSDLIHVKHKATDERPLCGFDPGDAPMAWTGYLSARVMATCAECLQEVLQDDCSICNGNGGWEEWGEEVKCKHCDLDAAQEMIENRGKPAAKPETKEN